MTKLLLVTEAEFGRLAEQVKSLEARLDEIAGGKRAKARAYLTPVEVAKRHGVRWTIVYQAVADGKLAAEKRARGAGFVYRIQPADAQRWYDAHHRTKDNQ